MDKIVAYKFIKENKEYLFPNSSYNDEQLAQILLNASDASGVELEKIPFKKASVTLFLSIFLGNYGIDRFYLGDYKSGILKLLTMGGLLVWTFIDILSAQKRCRDTNCKMLMQVVNNPFLANELQLKNIDRQKMCYIAKTTAPVVIQGAKDIKNASKGMFE